MDNKKARARRAGRLGCDISIHGNCRVKFVTPQFQFIDLLGCEFNFHTTVCYHASRVDDVTYVLNHNMYFHILTLSKPVNVSTTDDRITTLKRWLWDPDCYFSE